MARVRLATARLELREFEPDDATAMVELNSDPEVLRYTGDKPFESVEAARRFLEAYPDYRTNGFGRWAVLLRSTGEFAGWCGLKRVDGEVDLGYRLHRRFWGAGIATEAARASVAHGFLELGLEEIIARAWSQNLASIRVIEKCGLRFWKLARHFDSDGVPHFRVGRNELAPELLRSWAACQRAPDTL